MQMKNINFSLKLKIALQQPIYLEKNDAVIVWQLQYGVDVYTYNAHLLV